MEAKQAWLFVQCVLIVFDGVLLVVSGSCTTSCGKPAQGNIDITMCGADPSGTDDSTTAIQNAICNAKAAGVPVFVPGGKFIHNSPIALDSVEIFGLGNSSQIHQTYSDATGLNIEGFGTVVRDLRITSAPHNRTYPSGFGLSCGSAINYTVNNITLEPDPLDAAYAYILNNAGFVFGGGGFWAVNCSGGVFSNSFVHWTYADAIHFDYLCQDSVAFGNRVEDAGDDGLAVVGSAGRQPRNVSIYNNVVLRNHWGRGISAVGAADVLIYNNYVDTQIGAGIWVASETSFLTGVAQNVLVMNNVVKNTGVINSTTCWSGASLPAIGTDSQYSSPSMTGIYFTDNIAIGSCTQSFAIGNAVADVTLAGNSWSAARGQSIQLRTISVPLTVAVAGDTGSNASYAGCLIAPTTVTGPLRLFITDSEFQYCSGYGVDITTTSLEALQLTNSGGSNFPTGFTQILQNATTVQWIQGNQYSAPPRIATDLGVAPPIAVSFNYSITTNDISSPILIDSSVFIAQASVGNGLQLSLQAVYGKTSGTAYFDLTRTTVSYFPVGSEVPGSLIQPGSYTFNYVIASKDSNGTIQGIAVANATIIATKMDQTSEATQLCGWSTLFLLLWNL